MKKLMLLISLAAIGFSCAKKDNNTTPVYYMNAMGQCVDQNNGGVYVSQQLCSNSTNGYQFINGQCIQTTTGQSAPAQYCQNNGGFGGSNGYQFINGQCIQTTTGQAAPAQYCQNNGGVGGSNGYQFINGQCIQTTTGQAAPTQYCQNTGGVGGSMVCVGVYYYQGQQVQCGSGYNGVNNCSRYTLTNQQGQQVYCQ